MTTETEEKALMNPYKIGDHVIFGAKKWEVMAVVDALLSLLATDSTATATVHFHEVFLFDEAEPVKTVMLSMVSYDVLTRAAEHMQLEPGEVITRLTKFLDIQTSEQAEAVGTALCFDATVRIAGAADRAARAFERWVDNEEVKAINAGVQRQQDEQRQSYMFAQFKELLEGGLLAEIFGQKPKPKAKKPPVDAPHLKPVPKPEGE